MLHFRPFKPQDAETVFMLRAENVMKVLTEELGMERAFALIKNFPPHYFLKKAKKNKIHITEANGKIVGFCSAIVQDGEPLIDYFFIAFEHRNKGWGREMMRYLIDWSKKTYPKHRKLVAITAAPKISGGFYKKMGFKPIALIDYPYCGSTYTSLRLEKAL